LETIPVIQKTIKYFLLLIKCIPLLLPSEKKYFEMANHKATKKDARQALKRRDRNRYYGKTTRNAIRDLKTLETTEYATKLPSVESMIDKLAKRGVIHKNKAANLKSKLAKKKVA
jgi:small subunit ribosomal protein S20